MEKINTPHFIWLHLTNMTVKFTMVNTILYALIWRKTQSDFRITRVSDSFQFVWIFHVSSHFYEGLWSRCQDLGTCWKILILKVLFISVISEVLFHKMPIVLNVTYFVYFNGKKAEVMDNSVCKSCKMLFFKAFP